MNDKIEVGTISDEYAINRLFELATAGETGCEEYAQLDELIRSRLLATYDDGDLESAPDVQTAAAA